MQLEIKKLMKKAEKARRPDKSFSSTEMESSEDENANESEMNVEHNFKTPG